MRDGFRLDKRIWRDRAIELLRSMNSEILRLVEHEHVVGNEEKTSGGAFSRVIDTRIAPAVNVSDALGHDRERDFLVGVHRCTQSREIDGDRIDRLRLERASISYDRPLLARPSNLGRGKRTVLSAVHAQPSR